MAHSFDTGIKCPKCDGTIAALLGGPANDEVHEYTCEKGCTHDKATAAKLTVQVDQAALRYIQRRDSALKFPCAAYGKGRDQTTGEEPMADVQSLLRFGYGVFQAGPFSTFAITDGLGGELVQHVTNYAALVEYVDGQGYDMLESLFPDDTDNDQVDAAARALGFPDHPVVPKVDAAFDVFGALQWPHLFQPVKLAGDTPDYEKLCETLAGWRNINPLMRAFRDMSFDQTYRDDQGNTWDLSDGKINLVRCAKCAEPTGNVRFKYGERRHNTQSVRPTMRASEIVEALQAGIKQHKDGNPHVRFALTGDAYVEVTEGPPTTRLRVVKVTSQDHGYPMPKPGNTTTTVLLDMDDKAASEATIKAANACQRADEAAKAARRAGA